MAPEVPVGKQRHFPAQQRFVVRRQLARAGGELPAHQCVDGIPQQRVGVLFVEGVEVGRAAQVGKQEEPLREVLGVDLGCVHTRVAQQARDVHERSAIFLFGRSVHRDEAAPVRQLGAEVAPETRVL